MAADAMEEFGDAGWQPLAVSQPSASGGKQVESWADARTNDRCGGPADTQVFGESGFPLQTQFRGELSPSDISIHEEHGLVAQRA